MSAYHRQQRSRVRRSKHASSTSHLDTEKSSVVQGMPVHQKIALLEARLTNVERMHDRNAGVFSESLRMIEALNIVLQRVANDTVNGTARCFGDTPTSKIDFNSYLIEYWNCMFMADFASWARTVAEEKPSHISIPRAEDANTIIFGG